MGKNSDGVSANQKGFVSPKILILDIETFPNIAYVWGKYQQNVIRFKQETCIATFTAKWLGNDQIIAKSLPDYKGYKPGSYDDKKLVIDLWKLFDEADIIVAHNGDSFDIPACVARFIFHGLQPPRPYKTVDTKLAVKRVARFNSNKLDDLGQLLELGKKIKTDFDLWDGCINGNSESWAQMVSYNTQDVLLLEKLYLTLRPWMSNHPNLTNYIGGKCPKCGSTEVQWRGYAITTTRSYRRFQCKGCGGWGRVTKSEKELTSGTTNAV